MRNKLNKQYDETSTLSITHDFIQIFNLSIKDILVEKYLEVHKRNKNLEYFKVDKFIIFEKKKKSILASLCTNIEGLMKMHKSNAI